MASASKSPDAVGGGLTETDGPERRRVLANEGNQTHGRWHKYVKPRVGQLFQVDKKVLRSRSVQSLEETDSERSSSVGACAALTESSQPAAGRRGRPARGREAAVRLNETLGVKAAHRVAAAATQHIDTKRGGLCVHRPPTDEICGEKDQFLEFSRHIIMQTPAWNSPDALASLERRWKDGVADKFGGPAYRRSGSNISTGSGRKRGRKRKVTESDDDASGTAASASEKDDDDSSKLSGTEVAPGESALVPAAVSIALKSERKKVLNLEEDESMLSYLQSIHNGNCDVAKLSMLSDLSMGRAVQARRHLKKRRKEEEMEAPLSDMLYPSESWRRRYERLCSAMQGDVKNRPGSANYSYITGGLGECGQAFGADAAKGLPPQVNTDNEMLSSEGLKQTWRSVLECAEDIVDRTSGTVTGRAKPTLRNLLTLMGKAHTLMRPEEIFGKRDTAVKRISQCMNVIVDRVVQARNLLAKLLDTVYDEKDEGVELDALEKYIESIETKSPVVIEETETMRKIVCEASQWEKRLDHVLRPDHCDSSSLSESFDRNNILAAVERLASDAKVLSLRPRSLVLLETRIEKARMLRSRIREMRQSETREGSENKKLIAALVREANKLDLIFPELTMLTEVHEAAQEWTDRAAIAVRSRISLSELEDLLERGDTMPVNLSDLLEKLRSRVAQANGWIARLREQVGGTEEGEHDTNLDETKWLEMIRKVILADGDRAAEIQDLAVEGSRIPVDIPELHLLQVEIDARNWSLKAKKLLEKKGKLDDLREHLSRGEMIREKVPLDPDQKSSWTLSFEKEMWAVVESSDAWHKKYRPYLKGDNRRSDGRCRISITLLRQIVSEGNSINANLGNASVKMNRTLSQAEAWFKEHNELLTSFRISVDNDSAPVAPMRGAAVKMDSVNDALEKSFQLSIDLEEAMQLKALAEKSQDWFTRALAIAPKRSKRNARGKKKVNRGKHSLDELLSLVQEASQLPIDISEDLERLQMQLTEVQSWRLQAQCELKSIAAAFGSLQSERMVYYGTPDSHMDNLPEGQKVTDVESVDTNNQSPLKTSKQSEGLKVHRMIGILVKSVQSTGIHTVEEGIAEMLGRISKWCTKTAVVIATPGQIFEKRYFRDVDNLIAEGEVLLREGDDSAEAELDDVSLLTDLKTSWSQLVSDDKTRLEKCRERRNEFVSWCETTEAMLSTADKKIPIETLRDLGNQSRIYPKGAETVKKVQTLLSESDAWIEATSKIVDSGQKISLEDAKVRVAKGEGLRISCPEFRNLRNALRISRGWQLRVKRSKLDSGQSQISDIKALIDEHSSFLVCMPEEIKKLKEALQGYCLCRKPYEGFMVGCDACEEWYHGPCIGVSESQAERYDKYVCVRCVISKLFKGCAETTVQAIRKWTNLKNLTKARQTDGQRHQRKVREKRREIEKLKTEIEAMKSELNAKNGGKMTAPAIDELVRDLSSQSAENIAEVGSTGDSTQLNTGEQVLNGEQHDIATVRSNTAVEGGHGGPKNGGTETMHGLSDVSICGNGSSIDESRDPIQDNSKSGGEAKDKLSKAVAALESCNRRLDQLSEILNERKSREAREDVMRESLRRWFILVRAKVLVPISAEQGKLSRPHIDGGLSPPMDQAVTEATKLGIRHLPDVSVAINAFGCMSWSLRALHVLSRKPKIEEVRSLVSQSEGVSFKLPETKSVRMLQSPLSRATLWQAKVAKAMKPIPGEKKPYETELLSEILQGARDIPYTMPEESQLLNTIEDEGNRHCLCGGPSDGRFMIGCDKCEVWYHGDCVELGKAHGDAKSKWICPLCTGAVSLKTWQLQARNKKPAETRMALSDAKDPDHAPEEDTSQYAPNTNDLWPPFGLLKSSEALTALGVSDPSECEEVDALPLVARTAAVSHSAAYRPLNKTAVGTLSTAQKTAPKLPQPEVAVGSGTARPRLGNQMMNHGRERHPQAAGAPVDKSSELSRAMQLVIRERERISRSVDASRSGPPYARNRVQQAHAKLLAQGSQRIQHSTIDASRQSLAQANQRILQATQGPGSGPSLQSLSQGQLRLPHATRAPVNARPQQSFPQGRQSMPQAMQTPTAGFSQQSLDQGRRMLPQAAPSSARGPSQQSLQLLLGGGLSQSVGAPGRDAVQVTQAVQLMAQSLKRPATSDAAQASQAMQMFAQRENLGAGGPSNGSSQGPHTLRPANGSSQGPHRMRPANGSSQGPHTMQSLVHVREGVTHHAAEAHVTGGNYQAQQMQLIQGMEGLSGQVTAAGMRATVQPSSAMQLIQNVAPRGSFFQQNSSPALVAAVAAAEGMNETQNGLGINVLSTQTTNNGLSNQQHISVPGLSAPAPLPRQEHVGRLYPNAVSTAAGQRPEADRSNQVLPSTAVVPNNYTTEKRQRR